jgi:prepilin-type N-terminal cleavage/methylation domain-containing protein
MYFSMYFWEILASSMNNKSFTLIELLVVIAIIGFLISIVLVSMKGTRGKAKITAGLQFGQSINHALGAYAVGIWDFNDNDTPNTANDRSGYGNHGAITGATYVGGADGEEDATPYHIFGQGEGKYALSFDGNDYVNCGNALSLNITDAITIEVWVNFNYLDYTGGTGGLLGIAGKGHPDTVGPNDGWWFSYDNRNNSRHFCYTCFGNSTGGYAGGENNFCESAYNYTFAEGIFYHIAFTVTRTEAKLYINGNQHGPTKSISNLALSNTTEYLSIGQLECCHYRFNGIIDEVRIYEQALTLGQIQQRYAESAPAYGIVLK